MIIPQLFQRSACLLTALFVVACVVACDVARETAPEPGDPFPQQVLQELLVQQGAPGELQGKTLVINFWATWCAPCRREMPTLQRLSDGLDGERFMVVGVSVDEDRNLMQEFLLQHEIDFANVQDAARRLAGDALAVEAYPHTVIVSPDGMISHRISGERDWNSDAVHRLLRAVARGASTDQLDFRG